MKRDHDDDPAVADAGGQPPEKKKKKARWRNQKLATCVLKQLAYDASAEAVKAHLAELGCTPDDVRLVADSATREDEEEQEEAATLRLHAGLAYVVYGSSEAAADAVAKAHGSSLMGRKLIVSLLSEETEDSAGRFEKKSSPVVVVEKQPIELLTEEFVTSELLKKKIGVGVLDGGVIAELRRCPRAVAERSLFDVAKKLGGSAKFANSVSAYAMGVIKANRKLEKESGLVDDATLLSASQVDSLIERNLIKTGVLAKTDVDARCRSYAREFSESDLRDALIDLANLVTADKQKQKRNISNVPAFFMGILRDTKKGETRTPSSTRGGRVASKGGRGRGGKKGKGKGRGRGGASKK